ncbi:hypothetical protein CSA37_09540 [Candidatus Fermentibacteria bacterium]|nr:MAG: hypothetical protein CSA37_09540 [Candidatus Fermentibacteria bacterium]
MMKLLILASILFLIACGTSSSAIDSFEEDELQMMRDRLNNNACRINRENLIFNLESIEYEQDTTFAELPLDLFADSLYCCSQTGEAYKLFIDGGHRYIECPSGHGNTEF